MKAISRLFAFSFAVILSLGGVSLALLITSADVGRGIGSFASSGGVQQAWVARYNGPGDSNDVATAISVDGLGNVYVTGTSTGSGTGSDYATIKYDSAGHEQWVARYDGPDNDVDRASAIAVDTSGNVYVTGQSFTSFAQHLSDYATIKYDATGQEQWVARYNGEENADDDAAAIAIDSSGNVFVTGTSGSGLDYATIKYNSAGQEQWTALYNGTGDGQDEAHAIAVDGSGSVYVTGMSTGSGTGFDYATIKYDLAGQEQWVARYDGPASGDDSAAAIAVDSSGNVYVTGTGSGDYVTIKYDSGGQEQWVARYDASSNDTAEAIAVDAQGNVYVTGLSGPGNGFFDYATIKYVQAAATPTPTPTGTPVPTPSPTATPSGTPRPPPRATPRPRPRPHPRPLPRS